MKEKDIPIKKASIGNISKKDLADAQANIDEDPLKAVIFGFNVEPSPEVTELGGVKVFTSNIIYTLIEDYEKWFKEEKKKIKNK